MHNRIPLAIVGCGGMKTGRTPPAPAGTTPPRALETLLSALLGSPPERAKGRGLLRSPPPSIDSDHTEDVGAYTEDEQRDMISEAMETEDRQTIRDKRLPCLLLVTGILAICLILSVAAHLDAQPRGLNQACSQQIDTGRLNQILTKIEQRLTALEKQKIAHQPAAPEPYAPTGHSKLFLLRWQKDVMENQGA